MEFPKACTSTKQMMPVLYDVITETIKTECPIPPGPACPDALMVTAKEGSPYADILRTIKSYPDLQDIGDNVQKIRKCTLLQHQSPSSVELETTRKDGANSYCDSTKMADKAEVTCKRDPVVSELKDFDELTVAE
ncbi:unnamed protein product [Nezara viridula]|uniref:Uncharacterized protein n=1 Tax=Nezara viridula TaxID=85310 RepID=A0A9P0E7E6_NEZVI|nr:unnamed protein product [Nezara viridula]